MYAGLLQGQQEFQKEKQHSLMFCHLVSPNVHIVYVHCDPCLHLQFDSLSIR